MENIGWKQLLAVGIFVIGLFIGAYFYNLP
jgi:hypothetical protein